MEWVSENWIWLLLGLGMVGMHMFGHGRGSHRGHGSGHAHGGHGGGCCGGMGGHGRTRPEPQSAPTNEDTPDKAVDPVCGEAVSLTGGKTAVHDGRVYVFCSQECRDVFEANQQSYLAPSTKAGSVPSAGSVRHSAGEAHHA